MQEKVSTPDELHSTVKSSTVTMAPFSKRSHLLRACAALFLCLVSCMTLSAMAFQRAGYVSRRAVSRIRQFPLSPRLSNLILAQLQQQQEEVDPGVVEGTNLRIVKYPHPSLRKQNEEVTMEELQNGSIASIAKEMFLVMYASEGIGLAAPQVGINKRLMIFNESGDRKKWLDETVLVNPQIVESSSATDVAGEACLSFPDMSGDVERPKWVKIEALNAKGKKVKKKFSGWTARLFQHEYDHLDGIVYIDRLNEEGRKKVQPTLDELIKEFGEGGAL